MPIKMRIFVGTNKIINMSNPIPVYRIFPGEYECYIYYNQGLYGVSTGKAALIAGAPTIAPEDVPGKSDKASASLHHIAIIDTNGTVWVAGDNTCNISGTGLTATTIGFTKTNVTNAKKVIAYANSGNGPKLPDQQGLGYGVAVLTKDGKLILLGNTQSGFRGDGTEGNVAEVTAYTVTSVPKTITDIQVGSFVYALCNDGTVYSWGGTRLQYYPTYVLGRGIDNPDPTKPGLMKFPETIFGIAGGNTWSYFIGTSGTVYGTAWNTRFLGLGANVPGSNTPFNLTKVFANIPGKITSLSLGPQATYVINDSNDVYAWGDNTQAAIGNGQEGSFSNYVAPWSGGLLWVDTPTKIQSNIIDIFTSLGDAFYAYTEDTSHNLYSWGRNKGFVLGNGIGSTDPNVQATQPNKWDVLSPTLVNPLGIVAVPPPPPPPPPAPTVTKVVTTITWTPPSTTQISSVTYYSDGTSITH